VTAAWGILVGLHVAAAAMFAADRLRRRSPAGLAAIDRPWFRLRAPEVLLVLSLCLGLFSYIYAANANMDYVQRFMASGGNVRLAPDTRRERLAVALRYGPLLLVDLVWLALPRIGLRRARQSPGAARGPRAAAGIVGDWAVLLSLASSLLLALARPSFASPHGWAPLAWVCLVPLFVVLGIVPYRRGVFYGTSAGVIATLLVNYWLGTFHLLSLQLATVVALGQYLPFMAVALWIAQRARPGARFFVLPAAWVVFDWLRSLGFIGYPWGMIGTSQYAVPLVIQTASVGGVWMVDFLVLLVNGVAAGAVANALRGERGGGAATVCLFACFVAAFGWAQYRLASVDRASAEGGADRDLRLALVQQNRDPRKDDYDRTWHTLRRLSEEALAERPDLLVWSETAFVPNIGRWGRLAPDEHPYAALVHELLAWQKGTGTWLLTGNDDYDLVQGPDGEERRDYNASLLFSPEGERVETYHKIRLVPFTEYFPWKRQLPGLYDLLMRFDVYLWEPGTRRVVFETPEARFSTPICFEDAFPGEVREFARAGAEMIVNLSNAFWSLPETEAMQHAANAVFRAVENGVPLVRATASGLTCFVDRVGRITARAPLYEEAVLVSDVDLPERREITAYTRWGDWFPPAMAALLALLAAAGLLGRGPVRTLGRHPARRGG